MSRKYKRQAAPVPVKPAIVPAMQKAQGGGDYEDIDLKKLLRQNGYRTPRGAIAAPEFHAPVSYMGSPQRRDNLKSFFVDPLALETNAYGSVRTISPWYGRTISCRVLRRVSEKAWVLNLCIQNLTKKIRPYLKPATEDNQRGFRIKHKGSVEKKRDMTGAEKKTAQTLEHFFLHTGDIEDSKRKDDLDKYTTKILRDICQLDQIAAEIQRTRGGEVCAFWAVDAATVEVALPDSEDITGVSYAQVINRIPYAYYALDEFIFDCMNPRTDIEKAGYGYSIVEQAIDLVTSAINTFMYNAGFFTENKLPRGILLLNGDADTDEVEDIEDYISNLLSGPPSSQWKIPIIPSGKDKSSDSSGRRFEWVNLQGTNKEMEFGNWYDLQLSGVVGMFGFSMEDLGLHSQKSQPLIGVDTSPKQEASKSLVLGDMLGFLQKHFNQILEYKNPAFEFEFVGYEKDDPRLMMEIDKSELETYKSLNEKRAEKGLEPLDFSKIKNPADLPMNVQTAQLWQSQQQGGSPFGDMGGMEDDGFGDEGETEADNEAWGELEGQQGGAAAVEKSLAKRRVVRIVV
ncbi:MAG: phage portal protein [Treponema sp.]|jgi:hypothetical protein|nr:phage portal protein [Treponema sp.]